MIVSNASYLFSESITYIVRNLNWKSDVEWINFNFYLTLLEFQKIFITFIIKNKLAHSSTINVNNSYSN